MELTTEIKESINRSVLCWLATVSTENVPNVSPKEIFNYYGTDKIIVANIASPQTVRNIKQNENVCVSFIDILVQKGFQVKAKIIGKADFKFSEIEKKMTEMTGGNFPFATITEITVAEVKSIIAPKYILYPETTENEQIESAKKHMDLNIDYNNRRFRVLENSENGETTTEIIFEYKQIGNILTSEYSGGKIIKGHLIGLVDENGNIDMRYHQINNKGEIMTGICKSKPEILENGKVRLSESWEWTSGDKSKGKTIIEEQ